MKNGNGSQQCGLSGSRVAFVPIVVEILGGWSEEAVHIVEQVGMLVGQRSGSSLAVVSLHTE